MKKKLVLLLTLIVSLFIYSGRVLGEQVMFLECDSPKVRFFFVNTVGEGNIKYSLGFNEYDGVLGLDDFDTDSCWINNAAAIEDNCSVGENAIEKKFNINEGKCPETGRMPNTGGFTRTVVLGGDLVKPVALSVISENEYIVYRRKSDNMLFVEGYYPINGIYSHVNNSDFDNFKKHYQKSIITYFSKEENSGFHGDYWKVAHNFKNTYGYGLCYDDKDCIERYTVIFDSNDNKNKLLEIVDNWANKEGNLYNGSYNDFLTIANDEKFISVVDKMIKSYEEKGNYSFSDGYTSSQMFEKLRSGYELLNSIYKNPARYTDYSREGQSGATLSDAVESALQFTMKEMTNGYATIEGYCNSNDEFECLNVGFLNKMFYEDIKTYLNGKYGSANDKISILDLGRIEVLDEYTSKFLNAIVYLNKYSSSTDLSKDIIENELPDLRKNISDLGAQRDIFVTVDCDDLINDKLKERISYYYNFFKIIVSLALIVFGILDFSKAIFSGDDKNMKEAQTKFIKRIVVVVILFLVPLFVKFILTIANAVWSNIYPGACGLF